MIAVIRLRSGIKMNREIRDTLGMLKLKRINTLVVFDDKKDVKSMIKKIESFVTWGEISDEVKEQLKSSVVRLKPAKGGLRSIRKVYPKGDLGYRGKDIEELIKRMM